MDNPRNRTSRSKDVCPLVLLSFWLFLFSLLGALPLFAADAIPDAELEGILRKIESRHYRWIAIRADVLLFFAKAGDPSAMCGGELLYQRLDERMFLSCADTRQELMFVFRTLDRRFDLYLPAQNTVYHGSIFDLEDSPDIESHLKASDLYRALKPMTLDPRRTKVERTNSAITSLDVYGQKDGQETLSRKLYLTPEGDVRGEIFYGPDGRSATEIRRYDFQEIRDRVGSFDSIIFPKKITIVSPETQKGSAIFFTRVKPLDTIDSLEFILRVPEGTKEVFLDEKDPRFQRSRISAERAATAPPPKTGPVYLAKPLEKLLPKRTRTPTPEEKKTPKLPDPAALPAQPLPVDRGLSPNADAGMALSDQSPEGPSPAPNDQTTLDPSVDPSLEMGKQ